MKNPYSKGSVTLLVLVFGAIFLAVFTALAGYMVSVDHAQDFAFEKAEASSIAEAGLNLYEWQLAQDPSDTSAPDPSTIPYMDIHNVQVGTYTLSIVPDTSCPGNAAFDLNSVASPSDAPSVESTTSLVYVPPSGSYAMSPDCAPLATSTTAQFLNWQEQ